MIRRNVLQKQRGFTLIESGISVFLMALIFLVVCSVFLMMLKNAVATQAQVSSSLDANRAEQTIIADARESEFMALPIETGSNGNGFTPPTGYTASNFETTFAGYTVCTAVYLTKPATAASTIHFAGTTNPVTVYDRTNTSVQIWYYRADSNGTPDAAAGTCLWEYSYNPATTTVLVNQAVIQSIPAACPNAIQFQRPAASIASTEISFKVVSSYYSPYYATTNESTDGLYTTSLTGLCVRMRDSSQSVTVPAVTGAHWSGD